MTSDTPTAARARARASRFNRFVGPLLRLGVPIGPMYLLTVPGRRSGVPRTTPVATFTYEGGRYVMQGYPRASWVANARAAGGGLVGRGRRMRQVALKEVPVEERRPLLRHVGAIAPAMMRRLFVENGLISAPEPGAFEEAATAITIFRIEERA